MNHNPKKIVTAISYYHIEQDIVSNRKSRHKTIHQLTLFETEITSQDLHLKLESIYDISYRSFSNDDGLLYLHTNQGVVPFKIETDPDDFIKHFHKMKHDHQ